MPESGAFLTRKILVSGLEPRLIHNRMSSQEDRPSGIKG
jgi:hypothetical protein